MLRIRLINSDSANTETRYEILSSRCTDAAYGDAGLTHTSVVLTVPII